MPVPQPMSNMFIYLLGFDFEFEVERRIFERYLWHGGNYDVDYDDYEEGF